MPASQFDDTLHVQGGNLTVGGPFEAGAGTVIGDVGVRYIVIQHDAAHNAARVEGEGKRQGGRWQGVIGVGNLKNGPARGIAMAVILKERVGGDPPAFETQTWCQNVKIDGV